jgi:hypothetical protein
MSEVDLELHLSPLLMHSGACGHLLSLFCTAVSPKRKSEGERVMEYLFALIHHMYTVEFKYFQLTRELQLR